MTQVDLKAGLTVNLKKVSELAATTSLSGTDVLPVSSETGTLKKITATNLLSPLAGGQGNATVGTTPISGVKWYNLMGGEGIYVNFPESISANISLSSEDVEGGKQWAAIKYEGDTYWTKVQTAEESQSGIVTIPDTVEIPFNNGITVIEGGTMSGDETFTPITSGAIPGCGAMKRLVGNGSDTVYFSGFSKIGPGEFVSDNGTVNQLFFIYNGVEFLVSISQPVAIPVIPVSLTFQADEVGMNVITDGVQGATGSIGDFVNMGLDSHYLPSGINGSIQFKHTGSTTRNVIIGFSTANVLGDYTTMEAGIFLSDATNIVYMIESGALVSTGVAMVVGNFYRLERVGSVLSLLTSTDGVTFTNMDDYTFSSTANLYVLGNIGGTQQILFPTGLNLA